VGKKYPRFTGEGRLEPGERDDMNPRQHEVPAHMDVTTSPPPRCSRSRSTLAGLAGQEAFGFPAPVTMLFLAVVAKLTSAVTATRKNRYTV